MVDLIETETQLEEVLSEPTDAVCDALAKLDGDVMVLGVGGKMGPTLAKLARRAIDRAGLKKRVIGVSRFSTGGVAGDLRQAGIETISCDLLEAGAVDGLPEAANVVYMVGMKFGTTGQEPLTWAMNVYAAALAARRFADSRIVVLSTGNVYGLMRVSIGGATEEDAVGPIGEYAQSCLGRERIFQYSSQKNDTKVVLIRLNYAIDLRYGVLLDVARQVQNRQPIDLSMGHVNVIWQGDANSIILRAFGLCQNPPEILNVTGCEVVSIRGLAERFGDVLGVEPILEGGERDTALLSNASKCAELFGRPSVSLDQMIAWVAHWVRIGGRTLGKPTHFEQRDGRF